MIHVRRADERGHFNHGWLDTWHTFSFADYFDPAHMGFRSLRVMNEDRIAAGQGFGTHPRRDMEIVTYVLEGELEHRDSLGNGSVLHAGEFQRMTAGTGITHSEFNPSAAKPVHLYQIWLLPRRKGLTPGYEQRLFPRAEQLGRLRLVASPDGHDDSLTIQQDANIYLSSLKRGDRIAHQLGRSRHAWLQVLRGCIKAGSNELQAGDGLPCDGDFPAIEGLAESELMLFDLG